MTEEGATNNGNSQQHKKMSVVEKLFWGGAGLWFFNAFVAYLIQSFSNHQYGTEGLQFAVFSISFPILICGLLAFTVGKIIVKGIKKYNGKQK